MYIVYTPGGLTSFKIMFITYYHVHYPKKEASRQEMFT